VRQFLAICHNGEVLFMQFVNEVVRNKTRCRYEMKLGCRRFCNKKIADSNDWIDDTCRKDLNLYSRMVTVHQLL
jgi:hypothetical protein